MTLSIALVLSVVLLALVTSDSTAKAEPAGRRFFADTGVVTLGPDQFLRVSLAGDFNDDGAIDAADYVFRRIGYIEQGNIYRVASQVTTPRMRLSPGEAASIDIYQDGFNAVRCIVVGNLLRTDAARVRVTAQIINMSTGEVTSHIIMANTEGDFH